MKIYLIFTILLTFNLYTDQIKFSTSPSVSIVIPCIATHTKYLPKLLENISIQTLIPNEVVVSISQVDCNTELLLGEIESENYPFKLKLIKNPVRKFAGENRNIAINNSKGELIICQDADDLLHPERVEIISEIYRKTKFDILIHFFSRQPMAESDIEYYKSIYDSYSFKGLNYKIDYVKSLSNNKIGKSRVPGNSIFDTGTHFGSCAFPRKTFKKVQYNNKRNGQDANFVSDVLAICEKNVVLHLPLVYYILIRSSLVERNIP